MSDFSSAPGDGPGADSGSRVPPAVEGSFGEPLGTAGPAHAATEQGTPNTAAGAHNGVEPPLAEDAEQGAERAPAASNGALHADGDGAAGPVYTDAAPGASTGADVDQVEPGDGGSSEPPEEGESAGEPEPPVNKHSSRRMIREIVETVIMALLIFLAVRAVVQNFKVEGSSMYPTFLDGEFLLVNKAVYTQIDLSTVHKVLPFVEPGKNPERYIFHGPQRGDVIVFHPPASQGGDAKDYIKRVIGLPGDTVDFHNDHVYVDGRQVIEPYIKVPTQCGGTYCHVTLGPGQYYVMGDNRVNSSDSRYWGPASASKIIGKALFIYWCGGKQCSSGTDNIGLAPNHSTQLAPAAAATP